MWSGGEFVCCPPWKSRRCRVFAFDLSSEHVAAINRSGLRITGKADILARVTASDDPSTIPRATLESFATKSYVTKSAMEAVARCFGPTRAFAVFKWSGQRGDHRQLRRASDARYDISAGHVVSPGVVEMDTTGDTWIGPSRGTRPPWTRSGASPMRSTGPGCRRLPWKMPGGTVDQTDLQRRDEPRRCAHRAQPRTSLRDQKRCALW